MRLALTCKSLIVHLLRAQNPHAVIFHAKHTIPFHKENVPNFFFIEIKGGCFSFFSFLRHPLNFDNYYVTKQSSAGNTQQKLVQADQFYRGDIVCVN